MLGKVFAFCEMPVNAEVHVVCHVCVLCVRVYVWCVCMCVVCVLLHISSSISELYSMHHKFSDRICEKGPYPTI